ncbi:hypothetical protein N0V93_000540 [Gnomoniopsis smithogilvyi]|uniref:Major facilitator superfamily (MFS) profile domain-containing protein n=1 Tax=Gnomoniopsis smithogilvyi TaxID=1191159 RepID=A0A9W9D1U8_9PEZI|nr:hypothetical protein N0V93_000540 [Gnomoniopsis smithogilvyi]
MTVIQDAGTSSLQRRLNNIIRGEGRICLIGLGIATISFQTGYDSVVTAGFQGMPGFLAVFGYKDPSSPLGYNLPTHVQTLIQSLMTMGSLVSSLFVFLIGSHISRKTALWVACVMCIVAVSVQIASTNLNALYIGRFLLGLSNGIFTHTPRYYIVKGNYEKAAYAIRRLRNITDEDLLREEVEQMKNAHAAEQEAKGKTHFFDIFKGVDLRRTLLLYGLACSQVVTGRGFLSQFSVYFLGQAGISDPFLWVMITYIISLTGNFVASFLVRYRPRKTLLIVGLTIMAVAMFVMAIPSTVQGTSVGAGRVLVAMYIIHTWVGNATTMPCAACLSAEIPSQRLRPEMVGTSSLVIWGTAWLIAYTTPYFINPEQLNWGAKYAWVWGASCTILAVWTWAFVPETMGRSLEQIDELFKKRVPARKFRTFQVETENIDEKYSRRKLEKHEGEVRSTSIVVEPVVEVKG